MTAQLFAAVAGLAPVLGGCLALSLALDGDRMHELMALGAGFLLGGALVVMLPGALHASERGALYVAAGYLGMFLIRRLLGGAHCDLAHQPDRHAASGSGATAAGALTGLLIHSAVDGAALGAAGAVSSAFALTAFFAVFLHKLPEGFSMAALYLDRVGSRGKALAAAGAVGLATVAGAAAPLLGAQALPGAQAVLLGLSAGSFLYVGATDVLPTLAERGRKVTALVLLGAILIAVLARISLPGHSH